jgi:hypothetical protein
MNDWIEEVEVAIEKCRDKVFCLKEFKTETAKNIYS